MRIRTAIAIISLVNASCNYSEVHGPVTQAGSDASSADAFSWLRKEIFDPLCVRCHNAASPSGGIALDGYESIQNAKASANRRLINVDNPEDSLLLTVITSGIMPPSGGKVDTAKLAALKCWISLGAKKDTPAQAIQGTTCGGDALADAHPKPSTRPSPDPERVEPPVINFALIKKDIIDPFCLRCHNSTTARGDVDLTSLDSIKRSGDLLVAGNAEKSLLYEVILPDETGKAIMPRGSPALSGEKIKLMKRWIDEGAL